jgi:hypothetical protein
LFDAFSSREPVSTSLENASEHTQHDGTDKGDGHIRSHNTQPTGERTDERHWELSLLGVVGVVTAKLSERFLEKKVSDAELLSRGSFVARR